MCTNARRSGLRVRRWTCQVAAQTEIEKDMAKGRRVGEGEGNLEGRSGRESVAPRLCFSRPNAVKER